MGRSDARNVLGRALLLYMAFLTIVITLSPFRFDWPRRFLIDTGFSRFDFLTNVTLFIPLGFLFRIAIGGWFDPLGLSSLIAGAFFSVAIETTQMFTTGRDPSAFDVLANATGAWIGGLIQVIVAQILTRRLVDRLQLELPLMNLVYLMTPLLWLNARAAGDDRHRLWMSAILGLMGSMVMASVWTHRLASVGVFTRGGVSLLAGAWFLFASAPAIARHPDFVLAMAAGVVVLTRVQLSLPGFHSAADRRFEQPTLLKVLPLFAMYFIALSLWPVPWRSKPFHGTWGLPNFPDTPQAEVILRLLEYVSAVTLLGYLVAESRGRIRESFGAALGWTLAVCALVVGGIEVCRGYHPRHTASAVEFLLAVVAGILGGVLFQLQLRAYQKVVGARLARERAGQTTMVLLR